MEKQAKANVTPVRQQTQFTCMATSLSMCLNAVGIPTNEQEVNKVMGARPGIGASWEDAISSAQHFGARATLTAPATLRQIKAWTDQGIPVMIAWNPEGREWSHASVIFDVDEDLSVSIADPNIPDPDETVRVISRKDFYGKWYEKMPKYLFRRPACAIEKEITEDGRQKKANKEGHMKPYRELISISEMETLLKQGSEETPSKKKTEEEETRIEKNLKRAFVKKIAQRVVGGLYGHKKAVQKTCETCIRKLDRAASKIAKQAFKKDPRIAEFLKVHAKRSKSASSKILLAAIKNSLPQIDLEGIKTAGRNNYSMYGFPEKTAKLSLQACSDLKHEAGKLASDLHNRKGGIHTEIMSFFKEHSKQGSCRYAKLLHEVYPDAMTKCASAVTPFRGGEILWED